MKYLLLNLIAALLTTATYASENKVVTPILSLLLSEAPTSELSWGADTIGPQHRPKQAWLDQFNSPQAETVSVTSTIQVASDSCTTDTYCMLVIDQLALVDTVYLDRPKTKLLGVSGNKVSYTNAEGGAFFEIDSGSHEIVIESLNLDGESHNYGSNEIFGIIINGKNTNKIALIKNNIHHLHSNENGHGIAVYGSGNIENTAIQNIIIDSNEIHDLRTGSSESIAINGNVSNWQVTNNHISRVNNIAIVAIGGEGITPVQTINGRIFPGAFDAARYGFIESNTVTDMTTLGNPAYGSVHSWAGGIYVDGAHHISITNNTVIRSEWGYDIGVENCVTPNHIRLVNNTAADCYYGNLLIGGYAETGYKVDSSIDCNPLTSIDDDEGHGYVENVTVKDNQFNTPANSPTPYINNVELSYRIRQTVIVQPGVFPQHTDGVVSGDQNSIRVSE